MNDAFWVISAHTGLFLQPRRFHSFPPPVVLLNLVLLSGWHNLKTAFALLKWDRPLLIWELRVYQQVFWVWVHSGETDWQTIPSFTTTDCCPETVSICGLVSKIFLPFPFSVFPQENYALSLRDSLKFSSFSWKLVLTLISWSSCLLSLSLLNHYLLEQHFLPY